VEQAAARRAAAQAQQYAMLLPKAPPGPLSAAQSKKRADEMQALYGDDRTCEGPAQSLRKACLAAPVGCIGPTSAAGEVEEEEEEEEEESDEIGEIEIAWKSVSTSFGAAMQYLGISEPPAPPPPSAAAAARKKAARATTAAVAAAAPPAPSGRPAVDPATAAAQSYLAEEVTPPITDSAPYGFAAALMERQRLREEGADAASADAALLVGGASAPSPFEHVAPPSPPEPEVGFPQREDGSGSEQGSPAPALQALRPRTWRGGE